MPAPAARDRRPPRALAWALAACAAGCLETEPPGQQLGIFDVTSTLEENTCGPTAVITGEGQFAIELRRDRDTAYWQYLGGQPLVGTFEGEDSFSLELRSFVDLYGPGELSEEQSLDDPLDFAAIGLADTEESEGPGCSLVQEEELRGEVSGDWLHALTDGGLPNEGPADAGADAEPEADAGEADPPDLTAEHRQTLTPTADSDCSRALGSGGGPFSQLPCEIHYTLRATRRQ